MNIGIILKDFMPPLVKVGVWENDQFIGVILFGRGANNSIGKEFGLSMMEACELVRVALKRHVSKVSRIVSLSLKFLKKSSPGIRLIISYADPEKGHYGGIYQAMNWIYIGKSLGSTEYFHDGRWKHNREVTSGAFGGVRKINNLSSLVKRKTQGKHKYLMPMDNEIKEIIFPLSKPYPKRPKQAMAEPHGTAAVQH